MMLAAVSKMLLFEKYPSPPPTEPTLPSLGPSCGEVLAAGVDEISPKGHYLKSREFFGPQSSGEKKMKAKGKQHQ